MLKYKVKEIEGKLVLTSSDIKIGDKVYYNGKEHIVTINSLESARASRNTFKVIGEVSPDALGYVKEGDEFDEDQIQRQIYNDSGVDFPWENYDEDSGVWDENYWYSDELTSEDKRIQIKGPCGHFH